MDATGISFSEQPDQPPGPGTGSGASGVGTLRTGFVVSMIGDRDAEDVIFTLFSYRDDYDFAQSV